MNVTQNVIRCRVTFMDGNEMAFVSEKSDENKMRATSILDRMLKNQSITLVIDGALLIIPLTNIRTISISPAPNNLAGHTVINAHQV